MAYAMYTYRTVCFSTACLEAPVVICCPAYKASYKPLRQGCLDQLFKAFPYRLPQTNYYVLTICRKGTKAGVPYRLPPLVFGVHNLHVTALPQAAASNTPGGIYPYTDSRYRVICVYKCTMGWHYLSNATCLIQPHVLYAMLMVSKITFMRYIIGRF